jgi:eukaryotic-like serine/threonine-protein kinase
VPMMKMATVAPPVQTAAPTTAPATSPATPPPADTAKTGAPEAYPAATEVRPIEIDAADIVKSAAVKVAAPALVAVVTTATAPNLARAAKTAETLVEPQPAPTVALQSAAAITVAPKPSPAVNSVQAPKESPRDKRAREAKERAAKSATAGTVPAPALATGTLRLAVSPWGQVEVDGKPVGTTPPLNELTLTEGKHQVTIRNDDFPAHTTTVTVTPGQSTSVRHRFGS